MLLSPLQLLPFFLVPNEYQEQGGNKVKDPMQRSSRDKANNLDYGWSYGYDLERPNELENPN